MSRRPVVEPEPEADEDDDLPLPEITSTISDSGDWTVTASFASGEEYTATADDEAKAALMLGVGLAQMADRDDAPEDLRTYVGLIGLAYDGLMDGSGEN